MMTFYYSPGFVCCFLNVTPKRLARRAFQSQSFFTKLLQDQCFRRCVGTLRTHTQSSTNANAKIMGRNDDFLSHSWLCLLFPKSHTEAFGAPSVPKQEFLLQTSSKISVFDGTRETHPYTHPVQVNENAKMMGRNDDLLSRSWLCLVLPKPHTRPFGAPSVLRPLF